jgi:two-component system, chemotaxis family, CheB/CheR fusion protein
MARKPAPAGQSRRRRSLPRAPEAGGMRTRQPTRKALEEGLDGDLQSIVALLRQRVRFDFSSYRKGTLLRRLQRRMGLAHVARKAAYLRLLQNDPAEVDNLFRDLLIGVTGFFRDPKAWRFLEQKAVPALVAAKAPAAPLRAWVVGCATGEEAYSVAMLLIEQMQAAQKHGPIQVFATDVDTDALKRARAGIYPESIAADVTASRLRRFFVQGQHSYSVTKELRDVVIFAEQNLITDPPFSRLDLLSCRNLLIYLEPAVQRKILSGLHFSLVDGGYLFLGAAESVGPHEGLYETLSKRWRVYRRVGTVRSEAMTFPAAPAAHSEHIADRVEAPGSETAGRVARLAHQVLLERYAPASVVINRECEILYFWGRTDDYLLQPAGPPTQDLLSRARDGLQTALRGAIPRALRKRRPISIETRVKRRNALHRVRAVVEPLVAHKELEGLLLVSFQNEADKRPRPAARPHPGSRTTADEAFVGQLERELKLTREDLQATIEELEASNEELRAANEEVMSVNEELQSTNEELETSKEELQSLNEELITANSQLESKVIEVEEAKDDVENLLTSTNVPTVFLDTQLRIRRFTPSATQLFKLLPSDVGRPLGDITQRFTDADLLEDAVAVLEKFVPVQKQIEVEGGRWYIRQVLPYRTQDKRVHGVVLTFSDVAAEALRAANDQLRAEIAERERTEAALRLSEQRFRLLVRNVTDYAIIMFDSEGRVATWNLGAERIKGYTADEIVGKHASVFWPSEDVQRSKPQHAFETALSEGRYEGAGWRVRKGGARYWASAHLTPLRDDSGQLRGFAEVVRDESERKQAEQRTAELSRRLLAVQDDERRRIARELHDGTAQSLSAAAMNLAVVQKQGKKLDPPADRALAESVDLVDQCAREIRTLSYLLHPPLLDEAGLASAVRWYADGFARRSGVGVEVEAPAELGRLPEDVERAMFRVVQECLTNVHRHAHSSKAHIRLARTGESIVLTVQDHGRGIAAELLRALENNDARAGMGLVGMRERITQLGGRFDVTSDDGGTAVVATVPLKQRGPLPGEA